MGKPVAAVGGGASAPVQAPVQQRPVQQSPVQAPCDTSSTKGGGPAAPAPKASRLEIWPPAWGARAHAFESGARQAHGGAKWKQQWASIVASYSPAARAKITSAQDVKAAFGSFVVHGKGKA